MFRNSHLTTPKNITTIPIMTIGAISDDAVIAIDFHAQTLLAPMNLVRLRIYHHASILWVGAYPGEARILSQTEWRICSLRGFFKMWRIIC